MLLFGHLVKMSSLEIFQAASTLTFDELASLKKIAATGWRATPVHGLYGYTKPDAIWPN